ncbi:MAG: glutamine--tRNA ligase/YqeY domain fusion protein [Bacteriovoracaceae bacterium]|nr:glutamine--tRNA ligase/YqeY domain fusion protein [Bacteriovoracaceae bacterium]
MTNFIRTIIAEDLKSNKHNGNVITRFPPEPNGYLHIGHAKAICLNFEISKENELGVCHLRFDDTNPLKEEVEYIDSIKEDVKWLGYDWKEHLYFSSDYFEQLFNYATELIKLGKAYVCNLSAEEMRDTRGTLKEPGKNSPYRDRSIQENLELFKRMQAGDFEEGECILRAKIDMSAPNLNMRDPAIYRIRKVEHPKTGNKWCVYPMYDFTHCLSDMIEGITHSLCSLEFEDHRPLYDWFLDELKTPCHPQQIEFARLNINYTVLSKRKLLELVNNSLVDGWDDPRMPSISGMRRRGITPTSIIDFCEKIGVTKKDSLIDMSTFESCIREDLEPSALRSFAVLRPLKVVIDNYPDDKVEELSGPNHPKKPEMGRRTIPFSKKVYIEQDDFMEDPPKKYFRLAPGKEVRLRYGYVIKCNEVIKNDQGEVIELRCSYDPQTLGGKTADGRKIKGIIHWVSKKHAIDAEVRLYDRLFNVPNPTKTEAGKHFTDYLNPDSLETLSSCKLEASLQNANIESRYQFERLGYFALDFVETTKEKPVFNRVVTLRDSWAKMKSS